MKEIILENWEDFEHKYKKIYEENLERHANSKSYLSDILFRGQADYDWKLKTTLERFTKKSYSTEEYNNLLRCIKNKVE